MSPDLTALAEGLGRLITDISGTPLGARVAMVLALISAVAHAAFGALQKGRLDPWLTRGAIDICYGVIMLPVALLFVPRPTPEIWWMLVGVIFIHALYKLLIALAYDRGSYMAVYPIVRGTGPLVTVLAAGIVFGERFNAMQWLGILALSGGILLLGTYNLRRITLDRASLLAALVLAFFGGIMVAVYTTYDAYGIRLSPNPLTFFAWFFVFDGIFVFPWVALWRWRRMTARPPVSLLVSRGISGAFIGIISFGCVMLATRLDSVGEAAVLRETSVIFAGLIGWLFLREEVGIVRAALLVLIAAGAVLVEFG